MCSDGHVGNIIYVEEEGAELSGDGSMCRTNSHIGA